ncbi:protein disulfide-isomerase domain [Cladophialophora carrionii CBS 160.54]|uniref:Protein disulfide-isomerase domain n=1 Tax=Cladophialophora carrionii CBS 160.54 TaxID=1279043 RepID=V9D8M2_9EURO|nr:protein disulfide-isomerase domain [Cladophialophora carrionii CBS 160.54]ETI22653.1 protein disulfide-isomerase domain [Cladophialophora carrionii CBS 160.54]
MRPALLAWALAAAFSTSIAAPPGSKGGATTLSDDAINGETPAEGGEAVDYTVFNGIKVPPMKEIQGDEFAETIKDGYWWVKHYSPYCGHCKAIAPTWQTLYEFYATSDPLQGMTKSGQPDLFSPNSFHGYYNFHFASINCIAFGDVCDKNGVRAWPTFLLYKDGEFVEKYTGGRSMSDFSNYVEEKLEQIKPGSRPRGGVHVPQPGAKGVDRTAEPDAPLAKDKDTAAGAAAGEKQNKVAAAESETTTALLASETAKSGKTLSAKPAVQPNPKGTSVALTPESFQKLVTTSQDPWFVKFYVPWCSHCQHLAPTWQQMAKEMEGKLNIGEVNCEASPRLCKDAKVNAYPTIYFFRGGERVEYEGLRGLGDLLSFANKALDSDVKHVDAAAFKEMEETEEVIFVYFFDDATTSEDFAALDRLTLSLIGHAKIVKTDSEILENRFKISTWPRLLVSRDGRPTYYNALAPKDMRDFRRVLTWMQSNWLPIVPELSATNAKEIMDGKYVVLGILSRERPDEFLQSRRELKNAALEWMDKQTQAFQLERQELRDSKQLRIEEAEDRNDQRALRQAKSRVISITEETFRKQVAFAWVDGVFWERWLRSTYGVDVSKGERVIINDEDNRRYWDVTDSGAYIMPSRTSILETLPRIVANPPKLTPKSTIGAFENIFFQIRNFGTYHPYLSFGVLIISIFLLFWVLKNGATIKKSLSRTSSGYFHLDGKEGLLGTTNGKAD